MSIINRAKRFWALTKKDPKAVEFLMNMTPEQLEVIPTEPEKVEQNGVFFGEGTQEEYEKMKREDEGMQPWYERLKKL